MERSYSYFSILFVARLMGYLKQRKTNVVDRLNQKKIIKQNKIPLIKFVGMVKILCPQLNSLQIQDMFKQFSNNSQELKAQQFIYVFETISKKLPKKQPVKIETLTQQQRQTAMIGMKKLNIFLNNSDADELFNECDISDSNILKKQQLNKLLIISQIPELKEKSIRKILLDLLLATFPQGISRQKFFSFFKIDPIKQKEKIRQKIKKLPQMNIIKPQQPIKTPSLDKRKISQPVQQRDRSNTNQFKKKNHNIENPIILEAKKMPSYEAKKEQDQYIPIKTTHDGLHTNLNELLPRSLKYFRNGQPDLEDMNFMQSLQQHLKYNKVFVDSLNPATHKGKYASAYQIFGGSRYSLFQMAPSVIHRQRSRIGIARQIQPKDIMQGSIGDCYFLSAIASLVSLYPQMIAQRFLVNCNQSRMMGVKLFIDGQWVIFKTDDSFPVQYNKPVFAKPHGREIWVMLLEKCWAKAHKSYSAIESGTPRQGFQALTGAPCQYINPEDSEYKNNIKEILEDSVNKRFVTTVSGNDHLSSLSKDQQTKIGLVSDHSYSFLKLFKIGNETVFKLRNPWGNQVWKGRWSFNSDAWTPQLRQKYNYKKPIDDGSFYIDWNNFIKYFGNIVICKANPTFLHSSVRVSFDSRKSNYFQFTVQEQGMFNFTIYQTSKRIFRNYKNYDFSPARIIILKRRGQGFQYIGSMNKKSYNCSVQVKLTPGIYVLSAKIKWKFNNIGTQAVITSYGNQRVSFRQIDRSISVQFKKDMIITFMKKFPGEIKKYENINTPQAYNEKFFDIKKGIGYIKFCNNSKNKQFHTTVSFQLQGIKVIKPASVPATFNMKFGCQYVIGFFLSAEGYSYQSSQSIKYTV